MLPGPLLADAADNHPDRTDVETCALNSGTGHWFPCLVHPGATEKPPLRPACTKAPMSAAMIAGKFAGSSINS